jgi:hypothetical protein
MTMVVVLGDKSDRRVPGLLSACQEYATGRAWSVSRQGFDSTAARTGWGVISAPRAEQLYRQAHTEPLCVLSPRTVAVDRYGGRGPLQLGRLLRYKGYFRVVADKDRCQSAMASFDGWSSVQAISTESDPRVLPLHLFDPKTDHQGLDDEVKRQAFWKNFRNRGTYVDPDRRPWELPHANDMHGREASQVRNLLLTTGYHWDVQSRRATQFRTLRNSRSLPRGGYLNVYPDGSVLPREDA